MGQLKLLVLDDEPGIIDFISKIYRTRGFDVFGATDGIAALEIFKKERPHISLIDIHMPYSPIDGVEALRRIKEIDSKAICVMITRISEPDKVKLAREYGAFSYLLKPMDMEELDKALDSARSALTQQ